MNQTKDGEDAQQQKAIPVRYTGFRGNKKIPKVNRVIDSQGTFLEVSVGNITKRAWRSLDSCGSSVGTP